MISFKELIQPNPSGDVWKSSIQNVISSIWIYTIAGIALSLIASITAVTSAVSLLTGSDQSAFAVILTILLALLCLFGYYAFYKNIGNFSTCQAGDAEKEQVVKIQKAYLFIMIAAGIDILWFIPGIVSKIAKLVLLIIAYVNLIKNYKSLSLSDIWSAGAKAGAANLRTSVILLIVGACCTIIPLVGGFINIVLQIIAFIKMLNGFAAIRDNQ